MAGRRLSAEEAALWQRVAGSVRVIKPLAPSLSTDVPGAASVSKFKTRPLQPVPTPTLARKVRGLSVSNTLDSSWDKSISTGRVHPERTIDLHGYSLAAAHRHLDLGLDAAIRDGVRVILLVTGRAPRAGANRLDLPLRGIIRASVGDWLAVSRHASAIAAIRNAHPRHGGSGALYIILRRPK